MICWYGIQMCSFNNGVRGLRYDLHPMPEGDVILDLARGFLGLRVIPRRLAVDLAVDHDIVITRYALQEQVVCLVFGRR